MKRYIPIILVMLIWGSMGIPSTYAVRELSPLAILCIRSGIAAALLLPVVRHIHGSVMPASGELPRLAGLSIVGVVACNYLYFYAVQHTTLTHVAVLYALGPIITTVLAAVLLKEQMHTGRVVGMILAFGGVALLITGGNISQFLESGFNRGDAAQLLSSTCLALYSIFSKKVRRTPTDCATFWLMAISFLVTLPMVMLLEGGFPKQISFQAIASVTYLGVLCSGAGYLLQQLSIQRIGASSSAAFLNGISPITVLTAALILGEQVTPLQILCMGIILFGLILNTRNGSLHHVFHH